MADKPTFRLAPSSLTYLIEECPACFYRHSHGDRRPATPFPSVFSKMDRDQKAAWLGRATSELSPALPGGTITSGTWVASAAIDLGDVLVVIRGSTDSLLAFDDGSYGVVDFKTVIPTDTQVALYGRQLHAYALAMELPGKPWEAPKQVSQLGLLAFPPEGMAHLDDGTWVYLTHPDWLPVQRDRDGFLDFLESVGTLLASGQPDPNPDCPFCQWRNAA